MPLSGRARYLINKVQGEHDGEELSALLESQLVTVDGGTSNAAATVSVEPKTSVGVGAAAGTGVTAVEYGGNGIHKTVLTLASTSITMTDATTNGSHGAQKVYDFPAGPIQILGCSYDLTTLAGAGGITDTAQLVGSLGSVTNDTANATLTSTEADLIASTAGTLSSGAGTLKKHGSLVATAFDGTATAIDAFLNLSVPDAGSSANDTVAVSGTISIAWINLGDY